MFKEKFMPTNEPKKPTEDLSKKIKEIGKDFEKIAKEMKSGKEKERTVKEIVTDLIFETIHENRGNDAVEKFLEYERLAKKFPEQIRKNPREGLINQMVISYKKRKNLFDDPKKLKESVKKAILYFIEEQSAKGIFEIPYKFKEAS